MINDEQARKLGEKVTSQHPMIVFAMAKSTQCGDSGFKLMTATITEVRNDGCKIRMTICRGDLCEMKNSFYKFIPHLKSEEDLDQRLTSDVRNQVCSPSPFWLVTDPLALVILICCSFLAYGTYVGVDGIVDSLSQTQRLEATINVIFGSTTIFAYIVYAAFWFSVIAHLFEAIVAVYWAVIFLQLRAVPAGLWGLMIFLVGYPIFRRLQELVSKERGCEVKERQD